MNKTKVLQIFVGVIVSLTVIAAISAPQRADALGYTNPPNADTKTWAPQVGSLSITVNGDGSYKVRSDFKWTNLSGFVTPHTRYEHEIVFFNWDIFDCKYSSQIASNLVQTYLGSFLYADVHKPLSECLRSSMSTNLEGGYVDTRLFDKDSQGESYTVGTINVPQLNKDYYVEFTVIAGSATNSDVQVEGSLGHAAGFYATPLQFNPFQELAFCGAAIWIPLDPACTFRSSPENPLLVPRVNYNKSSSFFKSWNLVGSPPVVTQPPNPSLPCNGKNNGTYCGGTLGLSQNALYRCTNGTATAIQACNNGCTTQPAGTDDFCTPSSSGGSSCPNNENGMYCGSALGLDANTLYSCQNGVKTAAQACSLGCIQKPPGTADVCRTSTSGGSCPAGNGDYCGSSLGLDANTLFSCNNGNISVKQQCSNGCKLNPPGSPDACYPPGTGGGGNTGSKVVLYGDSNYGASTIRVQAGVGETEDPNRGSAYKSMSIPSGWSVILSDQHIGLVGNTKCFSQSDPNLETSGWAFSIESMKVYGTNVCPTSTADGIRICRNTGRSDCMTVSQDIRSLGNYGFGNDTLKSIEIGGSWEIVLFEDDNYGGRRYITGSNNDLGGTPFGYGASSVQVRRREPSAFQLYHLGDYNDGNPFKSDRTVSDISYWDSSTAPDDQKWNDKAQSIRVSSGYEIIACTDAGFHGVCGRANSDHGDLNSVAQGLRNGLSSIQVCLGSCAPTSVPPALISPTSNSNFTPGTPVTFSWSGNGDQYLIEYWGGTYGSNVQSTGWRDDIMAWTVTNFAASSQPYNWRVRSWTTVGESGWSPTYSFKVQEIAPVQVFINGATQVPLNTDQVFTALVSPSNTPNLQYTWSPAPKAGQGTATATYNWNTAGNQTISVTVQNTSGTANGSTNVAVQQPSVAPILRQIPGQAIAQGAAFRTINLNSYVSNLAQQNDLTWEVSGNNNIQVSITNGVATLTARSAWSGTEIIDFRVRNAANQGSNSSAIFTVNGPVVCAAGLFKAEYFNNMNLTGTPAMSRCEDEVNNDWGYQGPDVSIGVDNFSVRWSTTLQVTDSNSRYKFYATGDDGVKLYIDNVLVVDAWINQGETTYMTVQDLSVGNHTIKMEYYEYDGAAVARFRWDLNHIPEVTQIPGQSIFPGESFTTINLGDYVNDPDQQVLTWYYEGNNNIAVNIVNNVATLTYPNGWTGSESITFTVVDPQAASDSSTTNFAVISPFTCPAGQYYTYYYNNTDLSGTPAVTKCETVLKHSWGLAAPALGVTPNNFSARWTNTISTPVGGLYTFTTLSDEGVRLYIDDVLVIDNWVAHTLRTDKVSLYLEPGNHDIKMEYYEKTGAATAILSYVLVNKAPVVKVIPGQIIVQGQTFKTIDLSTYATDLDVQDEITWSYSGNKNITVSIDNNIATLTYPNIWVGVENITFKATDKHGASASRVASFRVSIIVSCPIGQYKAQYFNNMTLKGIPAFTRCETIPQYYWENDSPLPGINADNFSVRWTATVRFAPIGYYKFTTTSDDGVRLYVDNVLIINNWTDHAWTDNVATRRLAAGNHIIRMEYFENGGGAAAMLAFEGPGTTPIINPIPIQNKEASQGFSDIDLNTYLTDPDGNDPREWSIITNGLMISGSLIGDRLVITTPPNWIGTDYITVRVKDSYGLVASTKITFKSSNPGSCAPGLGNYCSDYYSNPDLSGTPVLTRIEPSIVYNWGLRAPVITMPVDNFSVRWQGNIKLAAGMRKFTTTSDNGVRLYVDGNLVIDNWVSHTLKVDTVSLFLTAGYHLVQMEYYDATGTAYARLGIL